jgi:hypothetical protein
MKFKTNLSNFLIKKSFYSVYSNGSLTSELWMNKDKLRFNISWLWLVVRLLCFICWIIIHWCMTHAFCSLLHVLYALSIVHDTSSKNAELSATSFPWRHTNTSKNHRYNAVTDDLCRWPFHAMDSALGPNEEGQEGRKGQTFLDHTHPSVSSRQRGRCVQSLVQIGSEMSICIRYKQTNFQLYQQK